jgi:APA family basic amino acid/polyamine antiporter
MESKDTRDKKQVFLRDATGLVKEASGFDILQFNAVSLTGVAFIGGSILLLPLMTYGTINIFMTITVGFLLALLVNMVYYIFSVTIPRSGGDYVYISRVLHPSLGVLSAGLTGVFGPLLLASTFGATVWVSSGLSPLLSTLGRGDLASSLTSTTILTVFGIIVTILFAALLIFGGNKAFFRLNNVLYGIAILGVLAGAVAFLAVGHNQFVNLFNSFAAGYGTNATGVINAAKSAGYTQPSSGAWAVFVGSALLYTSYYWVTQSAFVAGEVRNARKSHFFGMIGASVLWYVVGAFVIVAAYATVGSTLISSASYLDYFSPSNWKIPTVSFFALYANIAAHNIYLQVLISLAFIFGFVTVTGWSFIVFSRAVFALSFDRILPSRLADINDRFHTPVKAFVVFAVATIILLSLLTIPSAAVQLYTLGVGLNVVYMIAFFMTSIALAVLPYRHKQIFETYCPVKQKIGSIPAISVLGIASAVSLVFYEYVFITNSVFFGVTTSLLEAMAGIIVFFLAFYFVVQAYRKRQGLDIMLAYRELPPE